MSPGAHVVLSALGRGRGWSRPASGGLLWTCGDRLPRTGLRRCAAPLPGAVAGSLSPTPHPSPRRSEFTDTILSVHPSDVLDMPVDPNEPTYCLCHQVSYGEMIGCDNPDVSAGWAGLGWAGWCGVHTMAWAMEGGRDKPQLV